MVTTHFARDRFRLCIACSSSRRSSTASADPNVVHPMRKAKPSDGPCSASKELSPMQYEVTQHSGHRAAVPQRSTSTTTRPASTSTSSPASRCSARRRSSIRAPVGRASGQPIEGTKASTSVHDSSVTAWTAPKCVQQDRAIRISVTSSTDGPKPTGPALLHQLGVAEASCPADKLDKQSYGQYKSAVREEVRQRCADRVDDEPRKLVVDHADPRQVCERVAVLDQLAAPVAALDQPLGVRDVVVLGVGIAAISDSSARLRSDTMLSAILACPIDACVIP